LDKNGAQGGIQENQRDNWGTLMETVQNPLNRQKSEDISLIQITPFPIIESLSYGSGVFRMDINKKYIVDEKGHPKEVIIPIEHYRKMEELLGWELDDETIRQLLEAK
jgi:hypothetical protein